MKKGGNSLSVGAETSAAAVIKYFPSINVFTE